ncbi:MAG: peptide deformylase [Firmicutes bacterium]|nr:peptide deformylase [Bacillota bacterium]
MTVRNLCKSGDPVLRAKAQSVNNFDQHLAALLEDMADSLAEYRGVGIAAPQIGVSLAVIVIKLDDSFPMLEMINPEIIECSGKETDVEGCLSIPGIYGEVTRCTDVAINFLDRTGSKRNLSASGLLARIVQHEVDHLNGVLFTDKVENFVTEG